MSEEKATAFLATILTTVVIMLWITVAWVGLEYIIEGYVHHSDVDTIVAAAWSYDLADRVRKRAEKGRSRGR